ncbi:S-adenosyl-L-methionine-dependent methyltransferase [Gautieria morchelliformis]|nr:S-adenosyl-L-methionine-dependent methyltransferase [Gautieria morchelliformis]
MSSTTLAPAPIEDDPEAHEKLHVHKIYDQIAPHFSSTRYKPWPIIADFIASLPPGSVGLDSGTGNGKYLPLPLDRPNSIWTIGLDRSRNLLQIAQNAGGKRREVVWGDALEAGWRLGVFDYAISIATIHHLATPTRRRMAIETLLRCISPSNGRLLVYVWAVEQDHLSKRVLPSTADGHITKGQDIFVPWVLSQPSSKPLDHQAPEGGEPKVFNRYYHMFASGELEGLAREAAAVLDLEVISKPSSASDRRVRQGIEIVRSGWERSNWYMELKRWQI